MCRLWHSTARMLPIRYRPKRHHKKLCNRSAPIRERKQVRERPICQRKMAPTDAVWLMLHRNAFSSHQAQISGNFENQLAASLQAHRTQWTAGHKLLVKLTKTGNFRLVSNRFASKSRFAIAPARRENTAITISYPDKSRASRDLRASCPRSARQIAHQTAFAPFRSLSR